MDFDAIAEPVELELIVAFGDLTGFARACRGRSSREVWDLMAGYYALAGDTLAAGGGRVVKFIGDAFLAVFPADDPRRAVAALDATRTAAAAHFRARGLPCALRVKAHVGMVTAGPLGTRDRQAFDVLGAEVNTAALLPDGDLVLSTLLQERLRRWA